MKRKSFSPRHCTIAEKTAKLMDEIYDLRALDLCYAFVAQVVRNQQKRERG